MRHAVVTHPENDDKGKCVDPSSEMIMEKREW
jgi:hypothetical protein